MKISVIIPGYQCDQFIFRAIDSVLDQDFKNYEIIPILNGQWSTKGDLIKALHEKYGEKIRLQAPNEGGLGRANNLGVELSTGDIISHLSSDLYLMPGTLRTWMEAFDEHPDCDIVYSGYRFVSDDARQVYYSNPFDRYLLECENFIDGASPYRRKAAVKWNTSLKSLIDWDWALSMTDNGAKGWWIKEPLYFAEFPRPGGLSDDSNQNWVKRRREIQAIHHIPDRKICLTSPEKWNFALDIAKHCGFDFRMYPGHKPHEYSVIYSYGFPVGEESIQYSTGVFFRHFGHKVVHWTESDINSLLNWNMRNCLYYTDMVLKRMSNHFCMNQKQQALLQKLGINADIVYPPVESNTAQINREIISVNDSDLLDQIQKAMPDLMIKLNDPSAFISIHFQDDIINAIRFLVNGSNVITNDYLPYTHNYEGFNNIPELRKLLVHEIRRLIKSEETVPEKAIAYYKARTSYKYFKNKLERIAEKKFSKYAKLNDLAGEATA